MMLDKHYADFAWDQTAALLAVDSPSGFTARAAQWVQGAFEALGCPAVITRKGGVLAELGGEDANDALLLEAHTDTLGAMVCQIKGNGRLKLTPLGGMNANNAEGENVKVYTRSGKVCEGTAQLCNASIHVNGDYNDTKRTFDTLEVVLDENVSTAKETQDLGISVGDVVCFDPRKDNRLTPRRKLYAHITVYEEEGHGGSASVPEGVTEAISVDMGCVGEGLSCTERQVSICAKDSGGPYSYDVVSGLIAAAQRTGADYAVDVYPHYGSDVEATLRAGNDIRHGLIGSASHGYERSHIDGVYHTLLVLAGYTEVL